MLARRQGRAPPARDRQQGDGEGPHARGRRRAPQSERPRGRRERRDAARAERPVQAVEEREVAEDLQEEAAHVQPDVQGVRVVPAEVAVGYAVRRAGDGVEEGLEPAWKSNFGRLTNRRDMLP